ncbi:hypothetical protein DL767_000586 [Monosporascus sp. MG133]|nr:hypothetical protein DL767_000586 [Monosporascus sp. MG133]
MSFPTSYNGNNGFSGYRYENFTGNTEGFSGVNGNMSLSRPSHELANIAAPPTGVPIYHGGNNIAGDTPGFSGERGNIFMPPVNHEVPEVIQPPMGFPMFQGRNNDVSQTQGAQDRSGHINFTFPFYNFYISQGFPGIDIDSLLGDTGIDLSFHTPPEIQQIPDMSLTLWIHMNPQFQSLSINMSTTSADTTATSVSFESDFELFNLEKYSAE